jgi:hypothetical protein
MWTLIIKDLVSDDDLQFSGEYIVRLILTSMRMTRHTPILSSKRQYGSSGICARQTYGTGAYVKVITCGPQVIFD